MSLEVDALSDRIAILSRGKLKCCGTPAFLKEKFGTGFQIRLVKSAASPPSPVCVFDTRRVVRLLSEKMSSTSSSSSSGNRSRLLVESDFAAELNLSLESNVAGAAAQHLVGVLDYLDANKQALGLDSFSVSSSTLEQVFMR